MNPEQKDSADYIDRPDYPEYNQDLINPHYTESDRRISFWRPQTQEGFIEILTKEAVGKIMEGENYAPTSEFLKRVHNIIKTSENSETKEYYFSIDTLPYFQTQTRMLMSKGLVPTIRLHPQDRYGIPVYPIDEKKIQLENLPQGAFISLVKCPKYFKACNFILPLDVAEVKKAAEKGCSKDPEERKKGLGFTDKFSHTTHLTVATMENDKWNNHIVIPNSTYECYLLEQIKQYGTGLFEGIGVEKTEDGQVVIFRLDEHIKRMYEGAKIYDMIIDDAKTGENEEKRFQEFKELYTKMAIDTVRANWQYIPDYGKGRLYIRPDFFDHGEKMHVGNSGKFMMIMGAIPIGSAESYFESGKKAFFIAYKRSRTVEHSPEGTAKADGNYAGTIRPLRKIGKAGMKGIIYTNRKGDRIEESHASSVLYILTMKDGTKKLITSSLRHLTILDSITRKTSLTLAKNELGWETEERQINPLELVLYSIATKNTENPYRLNALERLISKKYDINEIEKMLKKEMAKELAEKVGKTTKRLTRDERTKIAMDVGKLIPTLQKLSKSIASKTENEKKNGKKEDREKGKIKKEYLEIAKNLVRIGSVAAGTGAALTSMDEAQIGELDRETDEIIKEKNQELVVFDYEGSGELGPGSQELFNSLLSAKSGKLQKELREKLAGASIEDKPKLEENLKEYESWLTIVPPPQEYMAQTA